MPLIHRLPGRRTQGRDLDAGLNPALRRDGIASGHRRYFFRNTQNTSPEGWARPGRRGWLVWVLFTARDGTWTTYQSNYWCTFNLDDKQWNWAIWRDGKIIMEDSSSMLEWAEAKVLHLLNSGTLVAAEKRQELGQMEW